MPCRGENWNSEVTERGVELMKDIKIFKNAFLIDGLSPAPIMNAMVIVQGSEIIHCGEWDEKTALLHREGEVFDLHGMTLMPGLIDTHVHLSLHGSPNYFQLMMTEGASLTALRAVGKVRRILHSGFTTIRTMGDKGHIDIAVKQAIESGEIEGPRILGSGQCLTMTGGHGDMFPSNVTIESMGRVVDGPIEARKGAREQLKMGADNIKLMATGGGMSPGPGTVSQLTIEEMAAAVEEAEKYGKTTGAHAIGAEGIINALHAGVRTIEHGTFLDDQGIELMLEKKAYLVPTLAAFKTLKFGKEGGVPESTIEKVRMYSTAHYRNLKKAVAAGVNVIVGTDAGTPFNYHGESAYELQCLVENGLSESKAIQCATKTAAEALKLPKLGAIAQGYTADLIVIDGNPLKDIKTLQNTERIKMVFKEGKQAEKGHGARK
jgi:imidazolonepropionase-like amidohydrolase